MHLPSCPFIKSFLGESSQKDDDDVEIRTLLKEDFVLRFREKAEMVHRRQF